MNAHSYLQAKQVNQRMQSTAKQHTLPTWQLMLLQAQAETLLRTSVATEADTPCASSNLKPKGH
jgi:hypothetical protein